MAPAKQAAVITLGLENRSPKRLRKLPEDIEVSLDTDVEGLKKAIAKASGIKDFNRIGLANPETKKLLKDRREKLENLSDIVNAGKVTVKDLGPQISWRGVFVVEYLGPILIHLAVLAARPYVFPGGDKPLSATQNLTFALFMIHFIKRELETLFVHKFSANTMPASNLFKNSAFYWLMSGLLCAVSIYRPGSPAALATADNKLTETIGTGLFAVSELANAAVHLYLSSLRSTGGTERKIPKGYGFGLVTCPNYMYEILAWIGVIIVSRDWSVALFISVGGAQMYVWAKGKEAAYRKEFGDKYKAKKTVLFPFLF